MATKSEAARAEQQRNAHPPKPKKARRPRRDTEVDTSLPGVSATDRKVGAGRTASRNESKAAARKGGAELEDSATGTPSRKSTRKTQGGTTTTSNLERRATRAVRTPKARATKAAAGAKGAKAPAKTNAPARAKAPAKAKAPTKR